MKKAQSVEHVAVYAGSFDPVTLGHLDVIKRAARLFDRTVVVVGVSSEKSTMFDQAERVEMLKKCCHGINSLEIAEHSGLTVDFAKKIGANILIRGLRSGADYNYEMAMAQMNRQLAPDIETVFIPTHSEFFHVSSTLVKDVAKHGGDLRAIVPPEVRVMLIKKLDALQKNS